MTDSITPDGLATEADTSSAHAQFESTADAAAEYADQYNLSDIGLAMRVYQASLG